MNKPLTACSLVFRSPLQNPATLVAVFCVGLLLCLPVPSQAQCACTSLTVTATGDTGIMCSDANLNLPECEKLAKGVKNTCRTDWAYICPLGVNSQALSAGKPFQKTGFLTSATTAGDSTKCKTGQVLQQSISSNRKIVHPTINPTAVDVMEIGKNVIWVDNDPTHPFPVVGALDNGNLLFGGDNYYDPTNKHMLFQVKRNQVSWWDNTDQSKDSKTEVAGWGYRFISFVQGSSGQTSCACAFDIDVAWAGINAPLTRWREVEDLSSPNCTFIGPTQ